MAPDKTAAKNKSTDGNALKPKKTITKATASAAAAAKAVVPAPASASVAPATEAAEERVAKTMWNEKTGVFFRYPRFRSLVQSRLRGHNIATGAEVPLADFCAFVCTELVRGSAKLAHQQKTHTITPRHVMLTKAANHELDQLIGPCIIADSGAVPFLPVSFRSKGEQKRLKEQERLLLTDGTTATSAKADVAIVPAMTDEQRAELKAAKQAARKAKRDAEEKAAKEAKELKKAAAKIAELKEKRATKAAKEAKKAPKAPKAIKAATPPAAAAKKSSSKK
jgi:hypothetical protein